MRSTDRPDSLSRWLSIGLLGVLVLGGLGGCDNSSPTEPADQDPAWLQVLIAKIESEPVTNPPSSIFRYRFHGATVYYRPGRCCDVASDLYDAGGALMCHPDGGLGGRGDGACTDFLSSRTNERLIWQDSRGR